MALRDNHLHVLLDALNTHRREINHCEPWANYTDEPNEADPRTTAEGYWRLINEVHDAIEDALSTGVPLTFGAPAPAGEPGAPDGDETGTSTGKGTCAVCHKPGLRLYRVGDVGPRQPDGTYPGWVWEHGPRDNRCSGSWEAPAEATARV